MDRYRILFVCNANRTRSPTLTALLKNLLEHSGEKKIEVNSCGIKEDSIDKFRSTGNIKDVMSGRKVREALKGKGIYHIENHRASKLSEVDLSSIDLVLTADQESYATLKETVRAGAYGTRVYLAKAYANGRVSEECTEQELKSFRIRDPYSRSEKEYSPGIPLRSREAVNMMIEDCEKIAQGVFKQLQSEVQND